MPVLSDFITTDIPLIENTDYFITGNQIYFALSSLKVKSMRQITSSNNNIKSLYLSRFSSVTSVNVNNPAFLTNFIPPSSVKSLSISDIRTNLPVLNLSSVSRIETLSIINTPIETISISRSQLTSVSSVTIINSPLNESTATTLITAVCANRGTNITFTIDTSAYNITYDNTTTSYLTSLCSLGASIRLQTPEPVYRITPSTFSIDEGSTLSFILSTLYTRPSQIFYWVVSGNAGVNRNDFTTISGSLTLVRTFSGNLNSSQIVVSADNFTEGPELFNILARLEPFTPISIALAGPITINDISIIPAQLFYAFITNSEDMNAQFTSLPNNIEWDGFALGTESNFARQALDRSSMSKSRGPYTTEAWFGQGENSQGSFGIGNNVSTSTFTSLTGNWIHIVGGFRNTFALSAGTGNGINQKWFATGENSFGQLGLGDNIDRNVFTPLTGSWADIVCGPNYTLALSAGTTKWFGTGRNLTGQLGLGDNIDRNVFTPLTGSWDHMVCGGSHTLALSADTTKWFGTGGGGPWSQLGLGSSAARNVFTEIPGNWETMVCGYNNTFALSANTNTKWFGAGYNRNKALGINDGSSLNVFTEIPGNWNLILPGGGAWAPVVFSITPDDAYTIALSADTSKWFGAGNISGFGLGANFTSAEFTMLTGDWSNIYTGGGIGSTTTFAISSLSGNETPGIPGWGFAPPLARVGQTPFVRSIVPRAGRIIVYFSPGLNVAPPVNYHQYTVSSTIVGVPGGGFTTGAVRINGYRPLVITGGSNRQYWVNFYAHNTQGQGPVVGSARAIPFPA